MHKLLERWRGGGLFNGILHCDWIMGRDPEMQLAHKVYAPEFFMIGQERSKSDVYGALMPRKFWNPPSPKMLVVNLHASPVIMAELRERGFFTGYAHDQINGIDQKLAQVFSQTENGSKARVRKLRDWIKVTQWEVAADPTFVCTVWHPFATPDLVKVASLWKVIEIHADTVEDALKQLPRQLRQSLSINTRRY